MILDLSSKDQIISAFSEFDLDQDQDHQKWSRSWSYRSLDQIFQRTAFNRPRLPRQFRRRDLLMDTIRGQCPLSTFRYWGQIGKSVGNQTWPCCWLQPPRAVHTRSPLNSVEARVRAVDIGPTDAGSPLTQKISIAESGGQHCYGYIAHFGIKILVIHQHYVTLLGDHCSLTFWHVLSLDSD